MILVTGASGYIGQGFLAAMHAQEPTVMLAGRDYVSAKHTRAFDLERPETFEPALRGVTTVVHLAGLGHGLAERESDYLRVNAEAVKNWMIVAAKNGVTRFILLSSMNVVPTSASDPSQSAASYPEPADAYSASKWQAERALEQAFSGTSCLGLIVRAALTYDRELHANLASLQRWVKFLPVALPQTGARTMVARSDLAALLRYLVITPEYEVPRRVWAATDGEIYDSRRIGAALGAGSLPLPKALWWLVAQCRDGLTRRRCGTTWSSLSGSRWAGQTTSLPEWSPTTSLEACLGVRP